jgi:hypothetical protein
LDCSATGCRSAWPPGAAIVIGLAWAVRSRSVSAPGSRCTTRALASDAARASGTLPGGGRLTNTVRNREHPHDCLLDHACKNQGVQCAVGRAEHCGRKTSWAALPAGRVMVNRSPPRATAPLEGMQMERRLMTWRAGGETMNSPILQIGELHRAGVCARSRKFRKNPKDRPERCYTLMRWLARYGGVLSRRFLL